LEIGVDVFVPSSRKYSYTLHYKVALIDEMVAMIGSWNCSGCSIFYDAEFSAVMFDQSDNGDAFAPITDLFAKSINSGQLVPINMATENFDLPML